MQSLLELLRRDDFNLYYRLYQLGRDSLFFEVFFYSFAKYGIVFFFFSFTYLIWNKRIKAFFCSFLSMGIAGFMDFVINLFWQRPRPYIAHPDLAMPYTVGLRVDDISFPSSHTYIAFAVATSVFMYGHHRLGVALFLMAILVAVARVGTGLHYPSDVVGGAILGIISGIAARFIVKGLEKDWE